MIAWALLALAAVGWSVLGMVGALGTPHPTLSTLVTEATGGAVGRTVLVGMWLVAGWAIIRWRPT
ncbi:MAG: hypothetical protein ACT4PI_08680 [Actinomycetota bacterium]